MNAPRLNWTLCAACLVVLVVVAQRALARRKVRQGFTRQHWPVFVALPAAALIVRLVFPPAFIHANCHGYGILEAILGFPSPSSYRGSFGQGSFLVLGLVENLFGGGWRTVTVTNSVANVGILVCAGILAYRAKGAFAASAAIAAGVFLPVFVRTAASEDAHNVACLFGMVALVAADTIRRRKRWDVEVLLWFGASTALAFYSRQTMAYWPFVAGALAASGRPWRSQEKRSRWACVAPFLLLGLLLLPGIATTGSAGRDSFSVTLLLFSLFAGFTEPSFLFSPIHPLFRLGESLPVLLLAGIAAVAVVRRPSATPVALLAGAAIAWLATIGLSMHPGYGVEYGFRLPLFSLLLPIVGIGADEVRRLAARIGRNGRWLSSGVAALLLGGLLLWPVTALRGVAEAADVQNQEYQLIRENLPTLTGPATLHVPVSDNERAPSCAPSVGLLRRFLSEDVLLVHDGENDGGERPSSAGPVYVYNGVHCSTYSLVETVGEDAETLFEGRSDRARTVDSYATVVDWFWSDPDRIFEMFGVRPPTGGRDVCRATVPEGARFDQWGEVIVSRHELPHVYYTRPRIPIGVWHIEPGVRGPP